MRDLAKDIKELLKDDMCKNVADMYARGLVTLPEAVRRMWEIRQIEAMAAFEKEKERVLK